MKRPTWCVEFLDGRDVTGWLYCYSRRDAREKRKGMGRRARVVRVRA